VFCFEMSVPLPSSTLAFAFGKFTKSSQTISVCCPPDGKIVDVSLYAAGSRIEAFEKEYLEMSTIYLKRCCSMLGTYPFSRLDLVVMPRSFACMGLKRYISVLTLQVPRKVQSESDFMPAPYTFTISPTCGFAFGVQERVFMWSICTSVT